MVSYSADSPFPRSALLALSSLALVVGVVLILYLVFKPGWETNDDVGMSMVAHGYGIARVGGSPNLVFSNVLWGHLVRSVPEINGVLGYSIATIGVLIIVGWVVLFSLQLLGVGAATSLLILLLALTRPILFPQFTVNAGLLLAAAVVCFNLSARQDDCRWLVPGCLLAFFSYLVRSQEFSLVLAVALPLLPWSFIIRSRRVQAAFLILVSAIAISAVIDHQAYQGEEWAAFKALNPARAPLTDFGANQHLQNRPDILARHGYSANDVDLIANWFFIDPKIAHPESLNAMVSELGPLSNQRNSVENGWIGIQKIFDRTLLPIVLVALLMAVLRPSWQIAASWGICFASAFALGLLGRPGVLRVHVPIICLLLIAPFLRGQLPKWRGHIAFGLLLVAATFNGYQVLVESNKFRATAEQTSEDLAGFPHEPVVLWGGLFPFEAVYPILGAPRPTMSYQFYPLGVFTLAPFAQTFTHREGESIIDLLQKDSGVLFVGPDALLDYLGIYCEEHLSGRLIEISSQQYGALRVRRQRCEVKR